MRREKSEVAAQVTKMEGRCRWRHAEHSHRLFAALLVRLAGEGDAGGEGAVSEVVGEGAGGAECNGAGMLAGGGEVLAAASSVAAWSSQQDLHPHVLHVYDSLSSKKAFSHHCPRGAHSFWSYLI